MTICVSHHNSSVFRSSSPTSVTPKSTLEERPENQIDGSPVNDSLDHQIAQLHYASELVADALTVMVESHRDCLTASGFSRNDEGVWSVLDELVQSSRLEPVELERKVDRRLLAGMILEPAAKWEQLMNGRAETLAQDEEIAGDLDFAVVDSLTEPLDSTSDVRGDAIVIGVGILKFLVDYIADVTQTDRRVVLHGAQRLVIDGGKNRAGLEITASEAVLLLRIAICCLWQNLVGEFQEQIDRQQNISVGHWDSRWVSSAKERMKQAIADWNVFDLFSGYESAECDFDEAR